MLTVGLTGGIGSGKSTVSALLAAHGAVVIDYDELARDVVEPGTPALKAIAERFGSGVIAADGSLDRPALGALVFADTDARKDLETITHPAIRDLAVQRQLAAGDAAIVVHDNPLLVEMGAAAHCDVVVVVDVPVEVQIERLMSTRQMTEAEARARINTQASREVRTGAANLVIDNSPTRGARGDTPTGSVDELAAIVAGVWDQLVRRATAGEGTDRGSTTN